MKKKTKLFIAGATGFTGQSLQRVIVDYPDFEVRWHARPESQHKLRSVPKSEHAIFEWTHERALLEELERAHVVVNLLGTTRRKSRKDLLGYDEVDIALTQKLCRGINVHRDRHDTERVRDAEELDFAKHEEFTHLIHVSSIGAGLPVGPYLKAKQRAENIVRESMLPYSILRPSLITGNAYEDLRPRYSALRGISKGFAEWFWNEGARALIPHDVEELARAILNCAMLPGCNKVLKGDFLRLNYETLKEHFEKWILEQPIDTNAVHDHV